jgi:ABC-type nitrate/sulfonate/bicarbonate transport system ATPase subunit
MRTLACVGVGKMWASPRGLAVEALRDVSLELTDGEFVAIVGPSGCGKSTLLELIAGLEPISSGEVLVDGVAVRGPAAERCMLFQEHSLFPWLSVEDNVAFGLTVKGVARAERLGRAREVLQRVGLASFARHVPHQLSGGMKQRVAIARALVADPDLLLMDEPFAALDFQTRLLMQRFLLEVWEGFGKSILFVTHQIDEAILLADRIYVMTASPGRILDHVKIALARPRSYTSPDFNEYRVHLTAALEREVMRAYAASEDAGDVG